LGSYDWDSLVTMPRGHYEAGAFNVRSGFPHATALAEYICALTAGESRPEIAALVGAPGWWRQESRLLYGKDYPIASLVA
jgi:dTDP-4-dehydrorhamnose reductase